MTVLRGLILFDLPPYAIYISHTMGFFGPSFLLGRGLGWGVFFFSRPLQGVLLDLFLGREEKGKGKGKEGKGEGRERKRKGGDGV